MSEQESLKRTYHFNPESVKYKNFDISKIKLKDAVIFNEDTEYTSTTIKTRTFLINVRQTELKTKNMTPHLLEIFSDVMEQLKETLPGYNIYIKTGKIILIDNTLKLTKFNSASFKVSRDDDEKKVYLELHLHP